MLGDVFDDLPCAAGNDEFLRITDPKRPDRGLRKFFLKNDSGCFIDSEDHCRQVWFRFVHDNAWRKSGNVHIGKQVLCIEYTKRGKILQRMIGTVKGWLPREESDFLDCNQEPAPLWRVHREDKKIEDLEEHELIDARATWAVRNGLSVYKSQGMSSRSNVEGVFLWRFMDSYDDAIVKWESGNPEPVKVSELFDEGVRVPAVEGLWTDMPLGEFLAISSPYPFRDCVDVYEGSV